MSDELKPCPHCGSATAPEISNCVELESCTNFDECPCEAHLCVVCSVHNGGCGACGGFAASEEGAVLKWNTRAAVTDEQFAVAVHDGEAWQKVRECEWRPEHDGENFTTECGAMFFWEPPTPPHCPYCGGRVKVVE